VNLASRQWAFAHLGWLWNWGQTQSVDSNRPNVSDPDDRWVWGIGGKNISGRKLICLEKNLTQCHFYLPQILNITLELNTDLNGEKLATDHQIMAQRIVLQTGEGLSNGENI
jgi:hypothetical protein